MLSLGVKKGYDQEDYPAERPSKKGTKEESKTTKSINKHHLLRDP